MTAKANAHHHHDLALGLARKAHQAPHPSLSTAYATRATAHATIALSYALLNQPTPPAKPPTARVSELDDSGVFLARVLAAGREMADRLIELDLYADEVERWDLAVSGRSGNVAGEQGAEHDDGV